MTEPKLTAEEQFRSSIADIVPVVQKLKPFCKTLDEMADMVELALTNDAQLRLLMRLILQK